MQASLGELNQKYSDTLGLLETNKKDADAVRESLRQIGIDYSNLSEKYSSNENEIIDLKRTQEIDDELLK